MCVINDKKSQPCYETEESKGFSDEELRGKLQALFKRVSLYSPPALRLLSNDSTVFSLERNFVKVADDNQLNVSGLAPMAGVSITSALSGAMISYQALDRKEKARLIDWNEEKRFQGVEALRGSILGFSNLTIFAQQMASGVRSVWQKESPLRSTIVVDAAKNALKTVGLAFSSTYHALFSFSTCMTLSRIITIQRTIDRAKSGGETTEDKVESAVKALIQQTSARSAKDIMNHLSISGKDGSIYLNNHLRKTIRELIISQDKASQQKVSSSEIDQKVDDVIMILDQSIDRKKLSKAISYDNETLSGSQLFSLAIMQMKEEIQNEQRLSTSASQDSLKLIKKAIGSDLILRMNSQDQLVRSRALDEAQTILEKVEKDLSHNRSIHSQRLAISICSAVLLGVATLFTSGVGLIVVATLGMLLNLLSCRVDSLIVDRSFNDSGSVGKYDLIFAKISGLVLTASVISSLVLISVFSFGVVPLVAAAVGGVISIISTIYIYRKIKAKKELQELQSPTLATLNKMLKKKNGHDLLDDKMFSCIDKLKKEDLKKLSIGVFEISGQHDDGALVLSEQDQSLDHDHNFGQRFFMNSAKDKTVEETLTALWDKTKNETILRLLERVKDSSYKDQEVKDFFFREIDTETQNEIFKQIYLKRLHMRSYWHLHNSKVTVQDLTQFFSNAGLCK